MFTTIFTIVLVSNVVVATVSFFLGGDRMRKNIEKELMEVLDNHKTKKNE